MLLAEDRDLGVADDALVDTAAIEAQDTIAELKRRVGDLLDLADGQDGKVEASALAVFDSSSELVAFVQEAQVEAAGRRLSGDVKTAFEDLRDATVELRDSRAEALSVADDLVGNVTNLTSFLVALLLPAGAILSYRFVTRRQMQVARAQLETRLHAEQRIHQAKDEFIANLSHELRTPLTSIYGFSEVLLEQGLIDPETALELIGVINSESADLARMVDDILILARIDAGPIGYDLQPVNIADELETVLRPFRRAGLTITAVCPSVDVWTDSLRLRQVLRNLVSNADRHGGPTIRVTAGIKDDHIACLVADDGPGVPEEMEGRLFTRFVHEGNVPLTVGSVGLGLAVAKSLLDGMGGNLGYMRVDGWTVFSVSVPLASDKMPAAKDEGASLQDPVANPVGAEAAGQRS